MLGRSSGCTLQLHVENEGHRAVIDEGDLHTHAEYARLNRHPQITGRLAEALVQGLRHLGMCCPQVAAIELLLREGLGRPPQAEDAASPRTPRSAEAIEKLGWNDTQMIFATHFASEIAAVTEDGGDVLLRERVAALDQDQRQLLREALDELAVGQTG